MEWLPPVVIHLWCCISVRADAAAARAALLLLLLHCCWRHCRCCITAASAATLYLEGSQVEVYYG